MLVKLRFYFADVDIVKPLSLMMASHDTSAKNAHVIQHQITITTLGLRKRLSLAIITCCYFIFVVAYLIFALHLIFKEKNFSEWYLHQHV